MGTGLNEMQVHSSRHVCLQCPILSARGVVNVGGILGKLVTVPGFTGTYTFDEIKKLLSDIGCCVVQQPQDVAPAEREVRDTASIIGAFHNNSIKAGNCSIIIDKIIVKLYSSVVS